MLIFSSDDFFFFLIYLGMVCGDVIEGFLTWGLECTWHLFGCWEHWKKREGYRSVIFSVALIFEKG